MALSQPLRFLVVGDWGGCRGAEPQVKIANAMAAIAAPTKSDTESRPAVSFVLALGDNFYRRGVDSVDDPRFKTSFEEMYAQSSLQVPWYLIAGNRDHKGNIQAQIDYTKLSTRWRFPALHYTVTSQLPLAGGETATIQFIFLDTMLYLGPNNEQQDMWLEDTLRTSTADWLFVCGHHPVYSGGRHGPTPRLVAQLRPLLIKYKVAAYMCGHDHNLQHIEDESGAVDYFVSGAGYETCDERQAASALPVDAEKFFWPPQVLSFGGFMSVAIDDRHSMRVCFHDSDGAELYSVARTNPRQPRRR